jgi:phospholipid-binding lipoprotein MlaA
MKTTIFFLLLLLIVDFNCTPGFAFEKTVRGPAEKTLGIRLAASDQSGVAAESEADLYGEEKEVVVYDPIEPVNRAVFWFNDKFYFYLLKPVARAYRSVPEPARVSVANFFSNLFTPTRFVHSLLQLKFKDAGNELTRFVVNTTVGVAGLFDPAKEHAGLAKKEEDCGQTLGYYGAGPGFYMVWPFWGPTNVRDGIGVVADAFLNPIYYLRTSVWNRIAARAYYTVNGTSLDKDTYESIKKESLDPYLTIRNAYAQRREALIKK